MRSRLRVLLALLALSVSSLAFVACGDDEEETDTGTGTEQASEDLGLIEEGMLTVGTDAPFPPFEIGEPGDPDFGGYDIDVMNAIAEQLGVEAEYTNTGFGTIFRD